MAVVSESGKRIEVSEPKDPSPSGLAADAASESLLIARSSFSADTPDRNDSSNSSPNPYKDAEAQSPALLRSEEYRQLFRLPPDEVLVEDFNCALQENILIQGHMYLFVHHICFYSNIFGFETKNFFASFLSRDEAFKIIHDGWLNHSNGAKGATEQQESASESSSQENGGVLTERVKRFESPAHESDSLDRNKDPPVLNDSLPINVEDETVTATTSEQQDNVGDAEPVLNAEPSSSEQTFILIIFFD